MKRTRSAKLPGRIEHLGNPRPLMPLVGIGDYQLHSQPAASGLAQESRPERLGLGRTHVHAEDFLFAPSGMTPRGFGSLAGKELTLGPGAKGDAVALAWVLERGG